MLLALLRFLLGLEVFNLTNVNVDVLNKVVDGLDNEEGFLAQEDNLSGAFHA